MSNNRMTPGPINNCQGMGAEAVCVNTRKVYDSCKDKECLQDLRVYLTRRSQQIFDGSVSVKPKSAELLWAYIDVEAVPFNSGFYTVNVKYFYRITADASCGAGRAKEISGIATYDKRTILFGSEGNVRIFSSLYEQGYDRQMTEKTNLPIAVVEVVDPVVLGTKIVDEGCCGECLSCDIPHCVIDAFEDEIMVNDDCRKLYVTLGQFSIIRLERDIQLLMPAYDICLPEKECSGNSANGAEDPCDLFSRFKFPVDEFFPPKQGDMYRVNDKKGRYGF